MADQAAAAELRAPNARAHTAMSLTLAAVCGVALSAAVLELLSLGVRKWLFGEILRVSRQIVWMAPLGELLLLLPLFVVIQLVGWRWRGLRSLRAVLCATSFVALSSVLLSLRLLHDVAIVLLAAGLAWTLARVAARDPDRLARALRRAIPVLVLLFLGAAAAVNGAIAASERAALAALPAARPGATNVILIIWDTVRAASLRLHGGRARTPNLERLAAHGVVFDRAVAAAPWTLPSHAAVFTGRPHHELDVSWTIPLNGAERTLAESLSGLGYRTGAFAANVLYVQWESGLAQGFTRFEDYRFTPGQVLISTGLGRRLANGKHGWETGLAARVVGYRDFVGRKRAEQVNAAALDWIVRDTTRPYFAFLNYFDAHLPFMPPASFAGRLGVPRARHGLLTRIRHEFARDGYWDMPPDELAGELAAYEESIEYLDDQLGALLDALEQSGQLDNTLVVVTSDHGEEFGEHGAFEHGSNLYMEQLHVPLVVSMPARVPQGVRIAEPVSIRDLAATIAEFTGIAAEMSFPGTSLRARWDSSSDVAPVFATLIPGRRPNERMHAIVRDRHHYIRNTDGSAELYDLLADPAEAHDIITSDGGRSVAAELAAQLNRALQCTEARGAAQRGNSGCDR